MTLSSWKKVCISNVLNSVEAGVSVNGDDRVCLPSEFGVLKVSAVSTGTFDPSEAKCIKKEEISRARLNPKKDHIIFSRANTPELVGASAYVKQMYPNLYLSDKLWLLSPKNSETVDMRWLALLLGSPLMRKRIGKLATGTSSSMKNISKDDLLNLEISLPSISEQKALAAILSTWDEAIEKTERLIMLKEHQFGWLINELIGKRKAEVSLVNLCPIEIGNKSVKNEEGLGYLEIGDIDLKTKDYQIDNKEKKPVLSAVKVPANTLLISTVRPTRGAITRTKSELYVSSAFCKLRLPNNFYFYCLYQKKFLNYLKHRQSGATYPTVKNEDILTFKIPVLSESEQMKIIRILNSAKQEIDSLKKLLDGYLIQKQGLIQKLLTGKWRVNFKEDK